MRLVVGRLIRAALSIAVVALVLPATGTAATLGWSSPGSSIAGAEILVREPTVAINDPVFAKDLDVTVAEVNSIAVRREGTTLVFTDDTPILPEPRDAIETLGNCEFGVEEVRCAEPTNHWGDPMGLVQLLLGERDDAATTDGSLRGEDGSLRSEAWIHGGAGKDRLRGGTVMFGGEGNDVLVSGASGAYLGAYLNPHPWVDPHPEFPVFGDPGNDRFRAQNGVSDRVYCGPGNDVVWADEIDELQNCEVVHLP